MLYEDNHLIGVFKPHGWLTHGDETGDPSLMDWVKEWLKRKYEKPGNVFLGLLHRLDRPVAGVVLFAKTSKGASRLSEQFRNRDVEKTYLALVQGRPDPPSGRLRHWLEVTDSGTVAHDSFAAGRLEARLEYRVLSSSGKRSLVEVDLLTGRKHQIRAQLAKARHPIVGDGRYGGTGDYRKGAIALASFRLTFRHPVDRERSIRIEAPRSRLSAFWEIA